MGFAIAQHYKARMKTMTLKICHQGDRLVKKLKFV